MAGGNAVEITLRVTDESGATKVRALADALGGLTSASTTAATATKALGTADATAASQADALAQAMQHLREAQLADAGAEVQARDAALAHAHALQQLKSEQAAAADAGGRLTSVVQAQAQAFVALRDATHEQGVAALTLKAILSDEAATEAQVAEAKTRLVQATTAVRDAEASANTATAQVKSGMDALKGSHDGASTAAKTHGSVLDALKGAFTSVHDAAGKVGDALGSGLKSAFSVVGDAASKAKDAIGGVVGVLGGLAGNIGGGIKTLADHLLTLGTHASTSTGHVHGLGGALDGLKSNVIVGGALAAGAAAANAALGALKAGLGALAGATIGLNDQLEQNRIAFTTMLGSGQAADSFLRNLAAFAAKTPFEFPDLVTGAQRLMAMGFSAQQVLPLLNDIGNVSAAYGKGKAGIDSMVTALGQMNASVILHTQDLNQLVAVGVPVWDILSKATGQSIPALRQQVEQGKIMSATFIQAYHDFAEHDFGDMMEKQSHTFSGAVSTIKDNLRLAAADGAKPFFDLLTEGANKIGDVLQTPQFQVFVGVVKSAMQGAADGVRGFFTVLDEMKGRFDEGFKFAKLFGGDSDGDAAVAGVRAVIAHIWDELNAFSGGMLDAGKTLVTTYAQGIVTGAESAVTTAVNYVTALIAGFFIGNSPPPSGPLSQIDKGGTTLMQTYVGGMVAGLDGLSDVAGSVGESFTKLDASATLPNGNPALVTAAGNLGELKSKAEDASDAVLHIDHALDSIKQQSVPLKIDIAEVEQSYTKQLAPLEKQLELLKQKTDYTSEQKKLQLDLAELDAKQAERDAKPKLDLIDSQITELTRQNEALSAAKDSYAGQISDLREAISDYGKHATDAVTADIERLKDGLSALTNGPEAKAIADLKDRISDVGKGATKGVDADLTSLKEKLAGLKDDDLLRDLDKQITVAEKGARGGPSAQTSGLEHEISGLESAKVRTTDPAALVVIERELVLKKDSLRVSKEQDAAALAAAKTLLQSLKDERDARKAELAEQERLVQKQIDAKTKERDQILENAKTLKESLQDELKGREHNLKTAQEGIQSQIHGREHDKKSIEANVAAEKEGMQGRLLDLEHAQKVETEGRKSQQEANKLQIQHWKDGKEAITAPIKAKLETIKGEKEHLSVVNERSKIEHDLQMLPIQQKIAALKEEEKNRLAPMKEQLTTLDNQSKRLSLQREQYQLLGKDIADAMQPLKEAEAEAKKNKNLDAKPPVLNLGDPKKFDFASAFDKDAAQKKGGEFAEHLTNGAKGWIEKNFAGVIGGALGAVLGGAFFGPLGAIAGSRLGNAIATELAPAFKTFFDVVSDKNVIVVGSLQQSAAALGEVARTTLIPALKGLGSELGTIIGMFAKGDISGAINRLTSDLSALASKGISTITQAAPGILTALGTWAKHFVEWAAPVAGLLLSKLGELIGSVLTWIGSHSGQILTTLASWGKSFVEWAAPIAGDLLGKLGTLLSSVLKWVSDHSGEILTTLGKWATSFVQWAAPIAGDLLGKLGALLSDTLKWIGDNSKPILDKLGGWAKSFGDWALPIAGDLFGKLAALLTSVLKWVSDNAKPIGDKLLEWGGKFVGFIQPHIGPMIEAAVGLLGSLTTWLTSKETLEKIGTQLGKWGDEFFKWVNPKIPLLMDEIGMLVTSLSENLVSHWPTIKAKMGEWGGILAGFVKDYVIPKLPGIIGELVLALSSTIGEKIPGVKGGGEILGTGLKDGFLAGLVTMANEMAGPLNEVLAAFVVFAKRAAGIINDTIGAAFGKPNLIDTSSWRAPQLSFPVSRTASKPAATPNPIIGQTAATGMDNWHGGKLLVGEAGRELYTMNGKAYLASAPTLLDLPAGERVWKNSDTERILSGTMGRGADSLSSVGNALRSAAGAVAAPLNAVTAAIGEAGGSVAQFIQNKVGAATHLLPHLPGALDDLVPGMWETIKRAAEHTISDLINAARQSVSGSASSTPPNYPGGNAIIDMALRTPGRNGWCEQFVGDVMQSLGLRYSREGSALTHSYLQSLSPGYGPPGSIVYWREELDPNGHVAFSVPGGFFGTKPGGTGFLPTGTYGPPAGFTMNPYADGGTINEEVIGVGLRSKQGYRFGEAGPEAVIPLTRRGASGASGLGATSGGTTTPITVIVQGSVVTHSELVDDIHAGLLAKQRTVGSLGIKTAN